MDEHELLPHLKDLLGAQLLVEETAEQFAFRHELIRQAAYTSLLLRERKSLHRTVGETMQRLFEGTLEAHAAELAHHFNLAEAWPESLEYSRLAGERALALYAPRAAVDHFDKALKASQALGQPASAELLRSRGNAYAVIGLFDPAHADLEAAWHAARAAGQKWLDWEIMIDLGRLWSSRDYEQAGDYFRRALELARALNDQAAVGHSLNRLGNYLSNLERPAEALPYQREALAIFEALEDPRGLADSYDLLGTTLVTWGDWIDGRAHYQRAAAAFRDLDNRQGLASSLAMLTYGGGAYLNDTTLVAASFSEGVRDGEAALDLAGRTGQRSAEAMARATLSLCLGAHGEYERALAMAHESLRLAQELEHRHWINLAHLALGALYLDLLAADQAQAHLETALRLAGEIGSQFFKHLAIAWLTSTQVLQGDLARAQAVFEAGFARVAPAQSTTQRQAWAARAELALAQDRPEQALEIVEELARSAPNADVAGNGGIPRLDRLRGEAVAMLGRLGLAEAALNSALAGARARGLRPQAWRILAGLARVHQLGGRPEQAAEAATEARATAESLAAGISDAALRDNFLRRALAHLPRPLELTPRQADKRKYGGLTRREREVAALIALGKSNRAIAGDLTLSERTVAKHIENIMSKLHCESRAQIAVWASEKGLLPPT